MSEHNYFLIILLLHCSFVSSQSRISKEGFEHNFQCGTVKSPTANERRIQAQAFQKWKSLNNSETKTSNETYQIPIVFHLIGGNYGDNQIHDLVNLLNLNFSHLNSSIEFCIAKTAPDGSVTNGITRHKSNYSQFDMDLEIPKLKTIHQWDPRFYLNVWLVSHINSEIGAYYEGRTGWFRQGAAGFANLPVSIITKSDYLDGIVVSNLNSTVLTHECGHYLGLFHTFDGGCKNDDCLIDGDMVCDTPPDQSIRFSCEDNSCHTDTLSNYSNNTFFADTLDMGTNFMDYGNSECAYEFSNGQFERMLFHLNEYRPDLANGINPTSNRCNQPCETNIKAKILHSTIPLYPIPNVQINFTSNIRGTTKKAWYIEYLGTTSPSYSASMEWGYEPKNSVIDTTKSFWHSFPQEGKYRVYLKAWDELDSSCFKSDHKIIKVSCGVDARFYPNKRLIASKLPASRFLDSVTFTNRSVGASTYQWTIKHQNFIADNPNLPDFNSEDTTLTYTFNEPGKYDISLLAKDENGCQDSTNIFSFDVKDPTIDGVPAIYDIECINNESLRVKLSIHNLGYDTINVGTPISFYKNNLSNPNLIPELLGSYKLSKIVYGFDNDDFSFIINTTYNQLDEIFAVFNDTSSSTFPIEFPLGDLNIYSSNTAYPNSGYAELSYSNNFSHFTNSVLSMSTEDIWACEDDSLTFDAEGIWQFGNWTSKVQGYLGKSNSLGFKVIEEDTIHVIWQTIQGCASKEDSFLINISRPKITLNQHEFSISENENAQFIASGGEKYIWHPPIGLDNNNISNPIANPLKSTNYILSMIDSIGCVAIDSVNVLVIDKPLAPTLFTPNGDFKNDAFKVYGLNNAKEINMIIRNRTGDIVFRAFDIETLSGLGWDGTTNDKPQPIGVYFWQVSGINDDDTPLKINNELTGIIHLFR